MIDVSCVEKTLHQVFGQVERWDYVSDGGAFPEGTSVAQFGYYRSIDGMGSVTLHVGAIGRHTRIVHEFKGIGAALPQASFPPAIKVMARASAALTTSCQIDLSAMDLFEIGKKVEALR